MKLRDFEMLYVNGSVVNGSVFVHTPTKFHHFIYDDDFANMPEKVWNAEVNSFHAHSNANSDGAWLNVFCEIDEEIEETKLEGFEGMQQVVEEFFDYLDECTDERGLLMFIKR